MVTRRTRWDGSRPDGCVAEGLCGVFAVMCRTSPCWFRFDLFALGLPRLPVYLDAMRATGLPFDCLVWAVLAEAEFLAPLTVLGGAYPPEFPHLLVSEAGPRWLGG